MLPDWLSGDVGGRDHEIRNHVYVRHQPASSDRQGLAQDCVPGAAASNTPTALLQAPGHGHPGNALV